jgi:hypothetical protein
LSLKEQIPNEAEINAEEEIMNLDEEIELAEG